MIVVGQTSDELNANEVNVYFNEKPDCDIEVVAWLQIPGDYYDRANLIASLRQQAAQLGAPALEITYLQKIAASEYLGSARAIRCLQE